jgi:hypothetical protein
MSGWDTGAVTSANIRIRPRGGVADDGAPLDAMDVGSAPLSNVDAQNQFAQFLRTHRVEDTMELPYRDEIRNNYNDMQYFVSRAFDHSHAHTSAPLRLRPRSPYRWMAMPCHAMMRACVCVCVGVCCFVCVHTGEC